MSNPFFHERDEICQCQKCNRGFMAYDYWEDCTNCNDGETDEGRSCLHCGGSGTHDYVVKDVCQTCLYVQLTNDD